MLDRGGKHTCSASSPLSLVHLLDTVLIMLCPQPVACILLVFSLYQLYFPVPYHLPGHLCSLPSSHLRLRSPRATFIKPHKQPSGHCRAAYKLTWWYSPFTNIYYNTALNPSQPVSCTLRFDVRKKGRGINRHQRKCLRAGEESSLSNH